MHKQSYYKNFSNIFIDISSQNGAHIVYSRNERSKDIGDIDSSHLCSIPSLFSCVLLCRQHKVLPTIGGKLFNTRQRAKSRLMRHATGQRVALCNMLRSCLLHVAPCGTGGIAFRPCSTVACCVLPKCFLGGIAF